MTEEQTDILVNRLTDRLLNPPVAPMRQRLFAMAFDSLMPFSLGVLLASAAFVFCFMDFAQVISSAIIQSCTVK